VYVELGRDEEAIAIYDEAISAGGDDFRPILSKALLLQAQGRDDEAQPLFSSAEALAPAEYKDEINRLATGETEDTLVESSDTPLDELSPDEDVPESEPSDDASSSNTSPDVDTAPDAEAE
jgi:tetratricopeptide (TPR) repeat protein